MIKYEIVENNDWDWANANVRIFRYRPTYFSLEDTEWYLGEMSRNHRVNLKKTGIACVLPN